MRNARWSSVLRGGRHCYERDADAWSMDSRAPATLTRAIRTLFRLQAS